MINTNNASERNTLYRTTQSFHDSCHWQVRSLIIAHVATRYAERYGMAYRSAERYAEDTWSTDCYRAIHACDRPGDYL